MINNLQQSPEVYTIYVEGESTMSFDGLVMTAVKNELQETIIGGRIEKIYQPLAHEILLIIQKNRNKFRLLISADARDARIHLTREIKTNPITPPLFCMVLRKHLEGGRILNMEQSGLERVLSIRVEAVDELGMLSEKILVVEVMSKHSNIILVDPAVNMILDGINRYSYATSRHREVLPGRQYIPPPESGKINPLEADEETFRAALWSPDLDIPLDKLILHKFLGFSPQTCHEIVVRTGIDPAASNQYLGELELYLLWKEFKSIRDDAVSGRFEATICYGGDYPQTFSAIKLTQFPETCCRSGRISEILDEFFSVKKKREQFAQAAADLQKTISREIKKCRKKFAIHEETLGKAKETNKFKVLGELITANIFRVPKGCESIEVINYYDPEEKLVTVQMDPQLSPAENAQAYFKKYAKARNSQTIAQEYLNEIKAELAYLESVMVAIDQAEHINDLSEIKSELVKEGYIKAEPVSKETKKQGLAPTPAPITFISQEGLEILVGRNNRQNDYLTMKLARPDDIWLHAKDTPGSHVIIRHPDAGRVNPRTLQEAAEIAAYYSKAKQSSKVPVDYTPRKHVRKPKGAKPGMVIYENQKTVIVEPKKGLTPK